MPNLVRLCILISLVGLTGCSTLIPGYGDSRERRYRRELQAQHERETARRSEVPAAERTTESLIAELSSSFLAVLTVRESLCCT